MAEEKINIDKEKNPEIYFKSLYSINKGAKIVNSGLYYAKELTLNKFLKDKDFKKFLKKKEFHLFTLNNDNLNDIIYNNKYMKRNVTVKDFFPTKYYEFKVNRHKYGFHIPIEGISLYKYKNKIFAGNEKRISFDKNEIYADKVFKNKKQLNDFLNKFQKSKDFKKIKILKQSEVTRKIKKSKSLPLFLSMLILNKLDKFKITKRESPYLNDEEIYFFKKRKKNEYHEIRFYTSNAYKKYYDKLIKKVKNGYVNKDDLKKYLDKDDQIFSKYFNDSKKSVKRKNKYKS